MITAAMRQACCSAMPALSKGTRDARLTVFEVGRGGGAVADRADDNRDDALRVPGDQCWIGQGFG